MADDPHLDPLAQIAAAIKARRISANRIALRCGVSTSTVIRAINGENDPGYSKVLEWKAALDELLAADAVAVPEAPQEVA